MSRYTQRPLERTLGPAVVTDDKASDGWNAERPPPDFSDGVISMQASGGLMRDLQASPGATVDRTGKVPPSEGAMVARPSSEGHEQIYSAPEPTRLQRLLRSAADPAMERSDVMGYLDAGRAQLLRQPETYMGAWKGPEGTYLDVSQRYPSGDQALHAVTAADQLGGYDLATGGAVPHQDSLFPMSAKPPQWKSRPERLQEAYRTGTLANYRDDPTL